MFVNHSNLQKKHCSQGENWFKFRTVVNPVLMQPRVTVQYVSNMDLVAQEFVENMKKMALKDPNRQMPKDFENELNKWALESISLIAIDKRLGRYTFFWREYLHRKLLLICFQDAWNQYQNLKSKN